MNWKRASVDIIFVLSGFFTYLAYHAFLYWKIRKDPLQTVTGINQKGRRLWVQHILKDNDKKNVLAVQTLRNTIMESTLMATTAVLLSAALATYMSYTTNIKQPMDYGIHTQSYQTTKLILILICLLLSFLCQTQSIRFVNHLNYMVNVPIYEHEGITVEYLVYLLGTATTYYLVGSRIFYFAFPVLLWTFGSVPMFLSSVMFVHVLYKVDIVSEDELRYGGACAKTKNTLVQIC